MAVKYNYEFEDLELNYLLRILKEKYELDYTDYRRAYLFRRVYRRMELDGFQSITELSNKVLHDGQFAFQMKKDISINVTDMFREPQFFNELRENVLPIIKTYPNIRIWHAGCSTGEEVLSLAILLQEEGIYNRCKILATDINEEALGFAKNAVYPVARIKQWTENYYQANGAKSFTDYYNVRYKQANFNADLLENVEYKIHDLTTNDYPGDFHLILCRNVLIYFNQTLQEHVISKFGESLHAEGFLGVGYKEVARDKNNMFKQFNKYKIYRLKNNV